MSELATMDLVSPDGRIVTVPLAQHINSPLVKQYVLPGDDGVERVEWRVAPDAAAKGWVSLATLYEAEQRLDDYECYLTWRSHARKGRATPIDEAYLPQAVIDRRASSQPSEPFSLPAKPAKPGKKLPTKPRRPRPSATST